MPDQPPDLSEFALHDENAELRQTVKRLERQLHRAKSKTEDLVDSARQGAKDAFLVMGTAPKVKSPKADRRSKKPPEVALLHLSDWQLGKETSSYNTEVALARIRRLTQKAIWMAEIERSDHPVEECHVMLGGDMIEGDNIFPSQAFEIDSTLFDQSTTAAEAIRDSLLSLLADFQTVHVWQEEGNHGRLGRKGDHPREDNADLWVYWGAQLSLKGQDRLIWHPRQPIGQHVTIGNYVAFLVHGDEVRSFGGNIPAFGIAKKVNAWATGVVAPFTDCYMGHYHQPLVIPLAHGRGRVFVNPSLESDSVYAKEFVGATGTPGQRLHFVEPVDGRVTTERILWLDQE